MNPTISEDFDFIARFLGIYKQLSEENKDIVYAFVSGMELQKELQQRKLNRTDTIVSDE